MKCSTRCMVTYVTITEISTPSNGSYSIISRDPKLQPAGNSGVHQFAILAEYGVYWSVCGFPIIRSPCLSMVGPKCYVLSAVGGSQLMAAPACECTSYANLAPSCWRGIPDTCSFPPPRSPFRASSGVRRPSQARSRRTCAARPAGRAGIPGRPRSGRGAWHGFIGPLIPHIIWAATKKIKGLAQSPPCRHCPCGQRSRAFPGMPGSLPVTVDARGLGHRGPRPGSKDPTLCPARGEVEAGARTSPEKTPPRRPACGLPLAARCLCQPCGGRRTAWHVLAVPGADILVLGVVALTWREQRGLVTRSWSRCGGGLSGEGTRARHSP